MKFLCDNCKAKYQIPDEKVAGRTLRMTCRKCSHNIVIRGESVGAAAASRGGAPSGAPRPRSVTPPPSSAARAAARVSSVPSRASAPPRGSSVPPRTGRASTDPRRSSVPGPGQESALSAGFQKMMAAPAATPAQPAEPVWHVAIHDVPVGPIHRDEIARKIGNGAVTAESLVWREGMEDWLPLGTIPELATLLEQRRVPSMPSRALHRAPAASARPTGPRARSGSITLPQSERSGSSLVPIASEPERGSGDFELDIARPSSTPPPRAHVPVAVAGPPSARPRGEPKTPGWVWGMLVAGIFFGVALGIKLPKLIGDEEEVASSAPDPSSAATVIGAPTAIEPEPEDESDEGDEEGIVGDEDGQVEDEGGGDDEGDEARSRASSGRSSSGSASRPAHSAGATTESSMAASAMAESGMTGDFSQFELPGSSGVTASSTGRMASASAAQPLDAAALQRVVTNNRRQLRTCYERAARGQASPPRARMDVTVSVGRSGTVTSVNAVGSDFGGLSNCIEQSVRRWRFPASSEGGSTRFPVVFAPAG